MVVRLFLRRRVGTYRNEGTKIFEEDFQRLNNSIIVILKMVVEIDSCKQTYVTQNDLIKRILFSLGGNDLMMVGSSSNVIACIKVQLTFSDVVVFFEIAMTFV